MADKINRFHLSLNVGDLNRSVDFFRNLLGQPPAKCREDYAKFEVNDPPLVLSLEPMPPTGRGALNHAGFRFSSSEKLVEAQRRLEMAGFPTQCEEGVECCYSKQTKFWIHDPDGNMWEFYVLEEDINHRGTGQQLPVLTASAASDEVRESVKNINDLAPIAVNCCTPSDKSCSTNAVLPPQHTKPPSSFEHFLGSSVRPEPGVIYQQIHLRGTFNEANAQEKIATWLQNSREQLAPHGELKIHVLTTDSPIEESDLNLPGPAAYVKHVPVLEELLGQLQQAGFVHISLETFRSQPCFVVHQAQLRETFIIARQPAVIPAKSSPNSSVEDQNSHGSETSEPTFEVLYKGPFAQITEDSGIVFRRGIRTRVAESIWRPIAGTKSSQEFVTLATPR